MLRSWSKLAEEPCGVEVEGAVNDCRFDGCVLWSARSREGDGKSACCCCEDWVNEDNESMVVLSADARWVRVDATALLVAFITDVAVMVES